VASHQVPTDASDPREEPALVKLVDALRRPEARIFARVAARRERLRAVRGIEGEALRDVLVGELIQEHALLSAGMNTLTALPFTLPVVGPWGTMAAAVLSTVAVDLALQTELVYSLAAALDAPLRGEALRLEAWRLVRFSSRREVGEAAWTLGKRIMIKRLAEKLLVQGAARLLCAVVTPGHAAPPGRGLQTAVGLAMTPMVAGVAWRDLRRLAERTLLALDPPRTDCHPTERTDP
jgi:hypothetical protein